jgi:ppGpp synthetase/RelA/SpoT-type nucleotidyltranferase
MGDAKQISPEELRKQIEAYTVQRPYYVICAAVMKRALKRACEVSVPGASVQTRAKTVSSFAEKCVRRYETYKDAVNELTDLCGARVIVQTLDQVRAVKLFIEANFKICESDDKTTSLARDTFGYRDMHYIVELRPDRCATLGITPKERDEIGTRKIELQVRTWLQHAWADTLHDRIYKNPLEVGPAVHRTGALLAALMEEGDRNFNVMAEKLDGMMANYTAYADRVTVEKEIATQRLILKNEPKDEKKPGLALKLARVLAATGDYAGVVNELGPYEDVLDANRCELLQDLGYALCRMSRATPKSAEYERGRQLLEESLVICDCAERRYVPDLRKGESLHARALSRLGWVLEVIQGMEYKARTYNRLAHEHEPDNPYYLSDMLGFEVFATREPQLPETMSATIHKAIQACCEHAAAGIEMPRACFTAGRLSLLLRDGYAAFGYYAGGVSYCLDGAYCVPSDALESEAFWVRRLHFGSEAPPEQQWVLDMLSLAGTVAALDVAPGPPKRTLIVSGGAVSMDPATLATIEPLIEEALGGFQGLVVSGGTQSGVPGCVGSVTAELAARQEKSFELIAYIPEHLPHDAPKDELGYDRFIPCGHDDFSPQQLVCMWTELLADGRRPKDVLVLGFGGGAVSAAEYHLALALGASVAVVSGTGGAADDLVQHRLWSRLPDLFPLPLDVASVRAFTASVEHPFTEEVLTELAEAFHENYVDGSSSRLPENMKPWEKLKYTFKAANVEQAQHAVQILEACGYEVRESATPEVYEFSDEEIKNEVERMAEMEHGRWNVERLQNGWRYGTRDDKARLHDCLVSWADLPESIRKYDRDAALNFPRILARANLEVCKPK